MARWLASHPDIFMSSVKEPHYFSTDLRNRIVTSSARYTKLFSVAQSRQRAIGEASTWYLYSQNAIPNIEQTCPGAKYIVMTRDPVEMAVSLHHHNLRVLHENEPNFEIAWALQEIRATGLRIPGTCKEPIFLQYKAACSLGSHLERLYAQVSADRVLHIELGDLQANPSLEYQRVLAFLDVPDDMRRSFPSANHARGYRSRTFQVLLRTASRLKSSM